MNEIIFKKTGHTLLNNGIIGVFDYLKKAEQESKFDFYFEYHITETELTIKCEKLFTLLEELYYWMGNEYYDTYTLKQQQNAENLKECNVYYDEKKQKFIPFPRMCTYGLPHLITNNAQGITRHEDAAINIKKLEEKDPDKLQLFKNYFEKHGLTLLKKLYFNEPYTKITRLEEIKEEYLSSGKEHCFLTGESFKKLFEVTNTTPFFSGLVNFNSQFNAADKKIGWKALYLSRFAAVHAFYHYPNKLRETLYIYLFSTDTLTGLEKILHMVSLKKTTLQLRSEEFLSNINIEDLENNKLKDYYTEQYEVAFMLLFSLYKKVLKNYGNLDHLQNTPDLFGEIFEFQPFSILAFRSDSLGNTLRPNLFSNINKLHFIVNTIHFLEKNNVNFSRLLPSLRLIKPTEKSAQNSFRLERTLRNDIAERFLSRKSILDQIEDLYFRSFTYLCSNEYVGFKDYNQIFNFFQLYESKIKHMDEQLQGLAINLGKQIGIKMRHSDKASSDAANAKKGRGDLISLRKARTQKQFLDELIRIDFKYGLTINEELASKIDEKNYYAIKQFLIIGALNILNPAIHPISSTAKSE